jgi:methionine sulfoxide reductase heme-binding subunit
MSAAVQGRAVPAPHGPALVATIAAALVAMVALLLAVHGSGEEGIRVVIRATARTSIVLFSLAFAASSLWKLRRGPWTRWLIRERRYLGLSFALSHLLHLLAICALYDWSLSRLVNEGAPATLIVGGIGYVFIAAMAATSSDAAFAWLGARRWRLLHLTGGYWIWMVFFASYAPRSVQSPLYAPFTVLLLLALGLRIAARRALAERRRTPQTASA